MRCKVGLLLGSLLIASCGVFSAASREEVSEPDWKLYRSKASNDDAFKGAAGYHPNAGSFVFRDLKSESDASLAHRLLGEAGTRIVHIERNIDRWKYYNNDNDPIERIALYSQPEGWGSAYGICRSEKYEISFSDDGKIASVSVSPRYGVEGPIFQKDSFDWNLFRKKMCQSVPGNHTPSYFPAGDVPNAKSLAILLVKAINLAGRNGDLPYELTCQTDRSNACASSVREYLSKLKLDEIDETSEINCAYAKNPGEHCYTVTVGKHRLGPFPKRITIRGSTHMNDWKIQSVEVREGFTIS